MSATAKRPDEWKLWYTIRSSLPIDPPRPPDEQYETHGSLKAALLAADEMMKTTQQDSASD
jgi:hypothetical protein